MRSNGRRRTVALAMLVALAVVAGSACGDDGGSDGGAGAAASGKTTTSSVAVPPHTDGPSRPNGDPALQAALLVADELATNEYLDQSPASVDFGWKYGVATTDDEVDLCNEGSPLRTAPETSQAQASYQDFFGGSFDERLVRYGSPEEAQAVLDTLRGQLDSCETWTFAREGSMVSVEKQEIPVPDGTTEAWGDDALLIGLGYTVEGAVAANQYVVVRRGSVLLRLHTAFGMGPVVSVLQYVDPALAKADEAGAFG